MNPKISVFTKPWKDISSDQLGQLVQSMGFNGIEFPLRPGFQADVDHALTSFPELVKILSKYGVAITSVASSTTEDVFAACQAAGVKILRIMLKAKDDYLACEDKWVADMEALYPLCEKYGVMVGVQHHYGQGIFSTMELRHFLDRCDPRYIGGIWDAAHSALAFEVPEQALDIIWDRLILVNLKNAYVRRVGTTPDGEALFKPFFCPAVDGATSWKRIVDYLKARDYQGDICMPAEYTEEEKVVEYLKKDVEYLKSLLA